MIDKTTLAKELFNEWLQEKGHDWELCGITHRQLGFHPGMSMEGVQELRTTLGGFGYYEAVFYAGRDTFRKLAVSEKFVEEYKHVHYS